MPTLDQLFSSLLTWLVGFVFFIPFTILRMVGLLLPSCASLGWVSIPQSVLANATEWIRFAWPVLKYVPWTFVWNFLSAILLYIFFKWLWGHLPRLLSLGTTFWVIIVVVYIILAAADWFIDDAWRSSDVFTEVFGENPSSTPYTGGGGGGGGGGSW